MGSTDVGSQRLKAPMKKHCLLFGCIERLEQQLKNRRYLVGEQLTEADIRLFPTLIRFDAVYHGHFKCNLKKLVGFPALYTYLQRLYALRTLPRPVTWKKLKPIITESFDNQPNRNYPLRPSVWLERNSYVPNRILLFGWYFDALAH